MRILGFVAVLAMSSFFPSVCEGELIQAPAAPLVQGHCSACHSLELVTSQRGNRAFWLKTIRWMQKTQKLWVIPEDQEKQILDYLATYYSPTYAPTDSGRRPPLDPSLMP